MAKIVDHIDRPCVIFRTDIKQYMIYGFQVIIFNDSSQANEFIHDFPMFFTFEGDESPFFIYSALDEMINDKKYAVWYDDIANKMDDEKKYQEERVRRELENKNMKGELKDE